jgi:hypothetical protein
MRQFTEEEFEQFKLVKDFRDKMLKLGIVVDFNSIKDFRKKVRKHLNSFAVEKLTKPNILELRFLIASSYIIQDKKAEW